MASSRFVSPSALTVVASGAVFVLGAAASFPASWRGSDLVERH